MSLLFNIVLCWCNRDEMSNICVVLTVIYSSYYMYNKKNILFNLKRYFQSSLNLRTVSTKPSFNTVLNNAVSF